MSLAVLLQLVGTLLELVFSSTKKTPNNKKKILIPILYCLPLEWQTSFPLKGLWPELVTANSNVTTREARKCRETWNNEKALQLATAVHPAQLCTAKFWPDGESNSGSTLERLYCNVESPQLFSRGQVILINVAPGPSVFFSCVYVCRVREWRWWWGKGYRLFWEIYERTLLSQTHIQSIKVSTHFWH